MPLTVVVRSGADSEALSLTFDSPRFVIGRGDGADLRLPDPSVSHRHASIRARGAEWVVIDEGSTNGTFLGKVMLAPQSPRVVRHGELVRVGRVWLEIRIGPAMSSPSGAAKEFALELVARAMHAEGEDVRPCVRVVAGPDEGKELRLDARKTYVVGKSKECELPLETQLAGRRHASFTRKEEYVIVRDFGSSNNATSIDGAPVGKEPGRWRAGQLVEIGDDRFELTHAAAAALGELERSPDERMDPSEVVDVPHAAAAEPEAVATPSEPTALDTAPAPRKAIDRGEPAEATEARGRRGWGSTDAAVLLLSLGVLLLSIAGLVWLFRR